MEKNNNLKKEVIDFEKEINKLKTNLPLLEKTLNIFTYVSLLISVIIFFSIIYIDNFAGISTFFEHLLYFAIGNMIYAFIFGKFFDLIYPKRLREIQRNTKDIDKQDVLNVFHNYFYPKEYTKDFEKIFEKYYRKDEEKFREWLSSKEITPKELYIKLIDDKALQKDINEEILKSNILLLSKNSEKIDKEKREEIKKQKEQEEKLLKVRKDIEEYFTNRN